MLVMPIVTSPESWRHHRSEEHTSELQSQSNLVCRLLLEKKKKKTDIIDADQKNHSAIDFTLLLHSCSLLMLDAHLCVPASAAITVYARQVIVVIPRRLEH